MDLLWRGVGPFSFQKKQHLPEKYWTSSLNNPGSFFFSFIKNNIGIHRTFYCSYQNGLTSSCTYKLFISRKNKKSATSFFTSETTVNFVIIIKKKKLKLRGKARQGNYSLESSLLSMQTVVSKVTIIYLLHCSAHLNVKCYLSYLIWKHTVQLF